MLRALLIDIIHPKTNTLGAKRRLEELDMLVDTYGGITVAKLLQKRDLPDYKTYVGSGKLQELIALAKEQGVQLIVLNNILKPRQMFALEELLRPHGLVAWDRVDLILKIFQKHASTVEAKLQIKLAAIKHMGPRIFGMGMELGQQQGGIGGRGGQGETNTELMKRHLFREQQRIERELERADTMRGEHRKRRERLGLQTVSIVGYTNAGKSSLLNALTKKGAYVANALFATLDTRVGKLFLPSDDMRTPPKEVLLSDTIGFIQDLPPELIEAFRSTLEETVQASLLLHVIDASDPYRDDKIQEVEEVLAQLGTHDTPRLYVFNKIDACKRLTKAALTKRFGKDRVAFVSAHTGEGLDELRLLIRKALEK